MSGARDRMSQPRTSNKRSRPSAGDAGCGAQLSPPHAASANLSARGTKSPSTLEKSIWHSTKECSSEKNSQQEFIEFACCRCKAEFRLASNWTQAKPNARFCCADVSWMPQLRRDCRHQSKRHKRNSGAAAPLQLGRQKKSPPLDITPPSNLSERQQFSIIKTISRICKEIQDADTPQPSPLTACAAALQRERELAVCAFCKRPTTHSLESLPIPDMPASTLPHEPTPDCAAVLGVVVHLCCIEKLKSEQLLIPIERMNGGCSAATKDSGEASSCSDPVNTEGASNDVFDPAFQAVALKHDLVSIAGVLDHPRVGMDGRPFKDASLMRASGSKRVLILSQTADAVGFHLKKKSQRREQVLSTYMSYRSQMSRRLQRHNNMHRAQVFEGVKGSYIDNSVPRVRQFCSHLDMLPREQWEPQLQELEKLPAWLYCQSDEDLLRLVRKPIPGMTSPQLYIKVPGVWTAAHEENNRFRSVNLNHGSGCNEWGGVRACDVERLRLCVMQTHGVDIYAEEGRWTPSLSYLLEHRIPVLFGLQRPGEIILVGTGCIHWVFSRGRVVSSAWNIGEPSLGTFESAFERWDANLQIQFPSLVPMHTLALDYMMQHLQNPRAPKLDPRVVKLLHQRLSSMQLEETRQWQLCKRRHPKLRPLACEPKTEGWTADLCSNATCRRELLNLYIAIQDSDSDASTTSEALRFHCYCTSCASEMLARETSPASPSGTESSNLQHVFCYMKMPVSMLQGTIMSIGCLLP